MNDELILRFLADWLKCLLPNMVIPRRKKHIFYITNRIDLINPKYVFAWFLKNVGLTQTITLVFVLILIVTA